MSFHLRLWMLSFPCPSESHNLCFTCLGHNHAEIEVLLAKDVILPAEMKSGFYSPYFIVPKKGGGFQLILDLRVFNRALHNKLQFKMLTQKCILTCIRHQDWFAAIDLKDAYLYAGFPNLGPGGPLSPAEFSFNPDQTFTSGSSFRRDICSASFAVINMVSVEHLYNFFSFNSQNND